ncbi:hypothetical protein F5X98DRAFT_391379 [Xylaria grammica]|nr:hypothetical protein F5X98DRAFT_391379 [Xylaria grammica]
MNRALRKLSLDEDLLSLVVLEKENRQDIAIFIASGLQSLNDAIDAFESDGEEEIDFTFSTSQEDGEAKILARIGEYIAENANGVILWVKLVMDVLIGRARRGFYTLEMLESDLEALPRDLVDFYRFAVSELEARFSLEELRITRSALMWVVGASILRPLALDELFEALGLGTDNKALLTPSIIGGTRQTSQLQAKSWLGFYRQLRLRCGPFIEAILPQTQFVRSNFRENTEIKPHFTVQLLHRTVKEFLHDREASGVLSFSQAEADDLVQRSMRSYLARVLPSTESAHSPVPAKFGDDLKVTVREMSEYLDKKFLLDFVLTNLPEEELLCHLMIFEHSVNPNLMKQRDNWPWNDSLEYIATRYLQFACENGLARTILIQLRIASILLLSWPTSLRYGPLAVALQKCARDCSQQATTAPQESPGNLRFQRKELVEAIDMLVTFSQHEQNLEWDVWAPAPASKGSNRMFQPQTRVIVPEKRALGNVLETMEIFKGKKPKIKDSRTAGRSKGLS